MGSFKLGKMTFGSLFKKPETILYPVQTRPAPLGLKGHIQVAIVDCILCGICMKRCPTGAIKVDKPAATWSIDRFRCVQCGSCVRECPKSCLAMDPNYAKPQTQKSIESVSKPTASESSEEEKAAKEALEAKKAAKIKAALEAKAAREKNLT
ncbi:MAG: 4Fe-4S binding protein [Coriobacteriaceae bacterium]|jgi:formate hydrogenlyase subunit 6/NADH:ubiquinone oxidoreductase subunit I|nr:4Fe-4S binding protein [Coriobacteriaceae bacterium]